MVRKLIFTCLLIFSIVELSQAQISRTGIAGRLVDSNTSEPIQFATVSLHNPADSSLIKGVVTNENGLFRILTDPGSYYLKIQFLSYQTKLIPDLKVIAGEMTRLGEVSLAESTEILDEVVVTGELGEMSLELDKRVFNVGKDINNANSNAADILDKLPSVTVDVEGNVSLRGSESVRILVNGKRSGLIGIGSSDGLRQLQGNLIERIEVITNPSARYDAEGSAGIINIVLKKDQKKGFNGSFTLNSGYPHDHGLSANVNYRKQKFNIFSSIGFNYDETPGGGSSFQQFFFQDTTYSTIRDRDHLRGGTSVTFRGGADFFINEKNIITGSFLTRISDEENNTDIFFNDFSSSGILISKTLRKDNEKEEEDNFEYDLSYKRQFKGEGHELTADIRYRLEDEIEDSDLEEFDLQNGVNSNLNQRSLNENAEENLVSQIDYVLPFGEDNKFEAGYKGSMRDIDSDFLVEELDENGVWVPLENFNNRFEYDENVYALYAIYENKLNKWGYQVGFRTELTDIGIYQRETQTNNDKEYIDFFPSAFLSYQFTQGKYVQASYSRRISRPRFWYLNPFFSFSDPRNIRTGNIDLDPEYTNSYELGILHNAKRNSIYFGAYYRHTNGVIDRISFVNEDGVTISQPQNLSTENSYGLELNSSYDLTDWWSLNGDFNFYRAITEGTFGEIELDRDTYTSRFRVNTKFKIDEYDIQLSGRYRAPQETTQGRRKGMYTVNLGANKDIFGGNGTITLSIRDLFNTRRWQSTSSGRNFFEESEFQWRSRQINLSLTYRINQQKRGRRGQGGYNGGDFEDPEF